MFGKFKKLVKIFNILSVLILCSTASLNAVFVLISTHPISASTTALAPDITHQPVGGQYAMGAPIRMIVRAQSVDDGYLTYQWQTKTDANTWRDVTAEQDGYAGWTNAGHPDIAHQSVLQDVYTPTETGQYTYRCVVTNHTSDAANADSPKTDDITEFSASTKTNDIAVAVLDEIVADTYTIDDQKTNGSTYTADDQEYYKLTGKKRFNQLYTEIQNGAFTNGSKKWGGYTRNLEPALTAYNANTYTFTTEFWDTTHGAINYPGRGGIKYIEDNQSGCNLAGVTLSTIYQELATKAGQNYEWSYKQRCNGAPYTDIDAIIIGAASDDTSTIWPYGIDGGGIDIDPDGSKGEVATPIGGKNTTNNFFYQIVNQLKLDNNWGSLNSYEAFLPYVGQNYAVMYQGHKYYVQLTNSAGTVNQQFSGSVSIPEGQNRTVFGFSGVWSNSGADQGSDVADIVFKPSKATTINSSTDWSGNKNIALDTIPGYAYSLAEVRGSSVNGVGDTILNQTTFNGGDAPRKPANTTEVDDPTYATLGDGTWFYPNEAGELVFTGLSTGKTYRVVSVPVGVISKTLNTNISPALVLDDNNYKDITVPIGILSEPEQLGTVQTAVYKDADTYLGKIHAMKLDPNNQYAVLKHNADGDWDTDNPVHAWSQPDMLTHEITFEDLALATSAPSEYRLITRPANYAEVSYADQAASGITVTFPQINPDYTWKLAVSQVQRERTNPTTDTLTVELGSEELPPDSQLAIYDPETGALLGEFQQAGTTYAIELTADNLTKDVLIGLQCNDTVVLADMTAYAQTETEFAVDYVNEHIGVAANNYHIAGTNDYRFNDETTYHTGLNTTGASVTSRINAEATSDNRTLTYTKHFNHAKDVGVIKELSFPDRPAAPTVGTLSGNVVINYAQETLTNTMSSTPIYEVNSDIEIPGQTNVPFSAVDWDGSVDEALSLHKSAMQEHQMFASTNTATTLVKRPSAPTIGGMNKVGADLQLTGVTPSNGPIQRTTNGTDWTSTAITGGNLTFPDFDGTNTNQIRVTATQNAPHSNAINVKNNEVGASDINLTMTYGLPETLAGNQQIDFVNSNAENVNLTALALDNPVDTPFAITPAFVGPVAIASGSTNSTYGITLNTPSTINAGEHSNQINYDYTDASAVNYSGTAEVSLVVAKARWAVPTLPDKITQVEAGQAGNLVTDSTLQLTVTDYDPAATLEYRQGTSGAWTSVTDGVISLAGLEQASEVTLQVRCKADDNHIASTATTATYYTRYATPTAQDLNVSYTTELYQVGSVEDANYSVTINDDDASLAGELTTALDATGADFKIQHNASQTTASATSIPASDWYTPATFARPAAPDLNDLTVINEHVFKQETGGRDGSIETPGEIDLDCGYSTGSFGQFPVGTTISQMTSGIYKVREVASDDDQRFASKILDDIEIYASEYRVNVAIGFINDDGNLDTRQTTDEVHMPGEGWTNVGDTYQKDFAIASGNTVSDILPTLDNHRLASLTKVQPASEKLTVDAGVPYATLLAYADAGGIVQYAADFSHLAQYSITIPEKMTVGDTDPFKDYNLRAQLDYFNENDQYLEISTDASLTASQKIAGGLSVDFDTSKIFSEVIGGGSDTVDLQDSPFEQVVKMTLNKPVPKDFAELTKPHYTDAFTGTMNFNFNVKDK